MNRVPPGEHSALDAAPLDPSVCLWMDEFPLFTGNVISQAYGPAESTEFIAVEGEYAHIKHTGVMAVSAEGIESLELFEKTMAHSQFVRWAIGRWDGERKEYVGGLAGKIKDRGFQYLILDNLGRCGAQETPVDRHFSPAVAKVFTDLGVRVVHVPPVGCAFNVAEPANGMIQAAVRSFRPSGRPLSAALGPTTFPEMKAAIETVRSHYVNPSSRGHRAMKRCITRSVSKRLLGMEGLSFLLTSRTGVAILALDDVWTRWTATGKAGREPWHPLSYHLRPITAAEQRYALRFFGKGTPSRFKYSPWKLDNRSKRVLAEVDKLAGKKIFTAEMKKAHEELLARRRRESLVGRPPTLKAYSNLLEGGSVSHAMVERVMGCIRRGLPCLPELVDSPAAVGTVGGVVVSVLDRQAEAMSAALSRFAEK